MKIKFILLLVDALLCVLGMFYWMYKSRTGFLLISEKSWHFKLIKWMWDIDTDDVKNTCPYYWLIVLSLHIIPFYVLSVYIGFPIFELLEKASNYVFRNQIPKSWHKLVDKVPDVNIPTTRREAFKVMYKNAKTIMWNLFIGGLIVLVATLIIIGLIKYTITIMFFLLVISVSIAVILGIIYLVHEKEEWNEYWLDPITDILQGVFQLIKLPFIILGALLGWLFTKLTGVYTNHCPPLKFQENESSKRKSY